MIHLIAAYPTNIYDILGLWTGLILMIFIYSYPMWKENPAYRFAEHTTVASYMAIGIAVTLDALRDQAVYPIQTGQWTLIIPVILGFGLYFLLIPSYRWVSRYPVAILVGTAMGTALAGQPWPQILSQIVNTIKPPTTGAAIDWFNFLFVAFGVICATLYFLLTYEHTGILRPFTIGGRYFIMLGLGAYFGNTVLFRFSMLASRAQFLLQVLRIIPM
jgi:hypothetical protein